MHETASSDTKRLEYQVTCEQIAFRLHRQVEEGRYADVQPAYYRALEEDDALARLGDATKLALLRCAARSHVCEARDAVCDLARRDSFFVLDERVQRMLLGSLAELPDDAAAIRDVVTLVDAGLARLPSGQQRFLASELDRARRNSRSRHALAVVVASNGFEVLSAADQRALVTYIAGPRIAAAMIGPRRAAMIETAWRPRVEQLETFVRRHHARGTEAKELARHLRAFLYAPRLEVSLLVARGLHHHDIVLLGEQNTASALSYGLRCTPTEHSARSFVFASPDPFVANDWQFPPRARSETYRFERYRISAYQEAALVSWLENNFPVRSSADTATAGRFSRPTCFEDGAFCTMTERFLDSLAQHGGAKPYESGFMREGQPTGGPMSATQRLRAFFARKQAA